MRYSFPRVASGQDQYKKMWGGGREKRKWKEMKQNYYAVNNKNHRERGRKRERVRASNLKTQRRNETTARTQLLNGKSTKPKCRSFRTVSLRISTSPRRRSAVMFQLSLEWPTNPGERARAHAPLLYVVVCVLFSAGPRVRFEFYAGTTTMGSEKDECKSTWLPTRRLAQAVTTIAEVFFPLG